MDHRDERATAASEKRGERRQRRSLARGRADASQAIPAHHLGGVLEGLAEVERGEVADVVEIEAFFRRYNP